MQQKLGIPHYVITQADGGWKRPRKDQLLMSLVAFSKIKDYVLVEQSAFYN